MIGFDLLILGFLIYSIGLLLLGYFLHPMPKQELPQSDYVLAYSPNEPDKPIMIRKPSPKPGGIFKGEDVPSGPVIRPTAKQLAQWKKNPVKLGTEEAMRETFANNPDLMEAKKFVESTHNL